MSSLSVFIYILYIRPEELEAELQRGRSFDTISLISYLLLTHVIDWLVVLGVLGRTANDIYYCFAFQFERQILHVNLNAVKHILILARTMQYLVI